MVLSRKSQGISLQTIVIAVLALTVLIVLILIFAGKIGQTGEGMEKGTEKFGESICQKPGTDRKCTTQSLCEQAGGFVYSPPQGGWKDVGGCSACCSITP